ncbi:hypothetical protein T4D_12322, partial [Trichinella pseudospiralis]
LSFNPDRLAAVTLQESCFSIMQIWANSNRVYITDMKVQINGPIREKQTFYPWIAFYFSAVRSTVTARNSKFIFSKEVPSNALKPVLNAALCK